METSVIVVKENTNQLEDSSGSTKKSKKILKIFKIDIDNIILSMILYGCKRKGGILPIKKEFDKGEIRNEKENWKSYYCRRRVY